MVPGDEIGVAMPQARHADEGSYAEIWRAIRGLEGNIAGVRDLALDARSSIKAFERLSDERHEGLREDLSQMAQQIKSLATTARQSFFALVGGLFLLVGILLVDILRQHGIM